MQPPALHKYAGNLLRTLWPEYQAHHFRQHAVFEKNQQHAAQDLFRQTPFWVRGDLDKESICFGLTGEMDFEQTVG